MQTNQTRKSMERQCIFGLPLLLSPPWNGRLCSSSDDLWPLSRTGHPQRYRETLMFLSCFMAISRTFAAGHVGVQGKVRRQCRHFWPSKFVVIWGWCRSGKPYSPVTAVAHQLFSLPSIHPVVEVYERHMYSTSGTFALSWSFSLFWFLDSWCLKSFSCGHLAIQ